MSDNWANLEQPALQSNPTDFRDAQFRVQDVGNAGNQAVGQLRTIGTTGFTGSTRSTATAMTTVIQNVADLMAALPAAQETLAQGQAQLAAALAAQAAAEPGPDGDSNPIDTANAAVEAAHQAVASATEQTVTAQEALDTSQQEFNEIRFQEQAAHQILGDQLAQQHLGTYEPGDIAATIFGNPGGITAMLDTETATAFRTLQLTVAADEAQITIITSATEFRIEGTDEADDFRIDQKADGRLTVQVNGIDIELTIEESQKLVIDAGMGDDSISTEPLAILGPGGALLTNTGSRVTQDIRVEGGDGNDTISAGNGQDTIIGGDGNDTIDAGRGRDYVSGGAGNDAVSGGPGDDTIYGLDGDDRINGDRGNDYIDGGAGSDTVHGSDGNDVVAGGSGDDRLFGGDGDDVVVTASGQDLVVDYNSFGNDQDRVIAQESDEIIVEDNAQTEIVTIDPDRGASMTIDPGAGPEFVARVESDLEVMRSTPEGDAVLANVDRAAIPVEDSNGEIVNGTGHSVTIIKSEQGNAAAIPEIYADDVAERPDGSPGPGADAYVLYDADNNTTFVPELDPVEDRAWRDRPPIVGFEHEILHATDFVTGERDRGITNQTDIHGNTVFEPDGATPVAASNSELSVTGLVFDDDNEGHPKTGPISDASDADPNDRLHTENTFRAQFNLPPRVRY
ncbi:MAG: hypothetical protein ACI8TP_001026 [Acidimicrobiales bacterium]|jgi:hypothetical protein